MWEKIMGWIGFVRCRVCNKFTEPSVLIGNLCSFKCFEKEKLLMREKSGEV